MDTAKCEEVIIADIARRGTGNDLTSPVRIILQVFAKDGTLIAERDPCIKQMLQVALDANDIERAKDIVSCML